MIDPIPSCASALTVRGYLPGAVLVVAGPGLGPELIKPTGDQVVVPLGGTATSGQVFTAEQRIGDECESLPNAGPRCRVGPPASRAVSPDPVPLEPPIVAPAGVYPCSTDLEAYGVAPLASVTFQASTLGLPWVDLETVTAEPLPGLQGGVARARSFDPSSFPSGTSFRAVQTLCGDSRESASVPLVPEPAELQAPELGDDPLPPFFGHRNRTVATVRLKHPGGWVHIHEEGDPNRPYPNLTSELAPPRRAVFGLNGDPHDNLMRRRVRSSNERVLGSYILSGTRLCARQMLRTCSGQWLSSDSSACEEVVHDPLPTPTPPVPCADVLPPKVENPQFGATALRLVGVSPLLAATRVFMDGTLIGEARGTVVPLRRPLEIGSVLHIVGVPLDPACPETAKAYRITVRCNPTELLAHPVRDGHPLFAVGHRDFDIFAFVPGQRLAGRVYYPAMTDGADTSPRALAGGVPLVILSPGNYGNFTNGTDMSQQPRPGDYPTQGYLGYEAIARPLVRRGAVVVSINAEAINGTLYTRENLDHRRALIEALADRIQARQSPSPLEVIEGAQVVGNRLLLIGHSRGGQASIEAASRLKSTWDVAVLSLAGTDGRVRWDFSKGEWWDVNYLGAPTSAPLVGVPLLVFGGSSDQDSKSLGSTHYDRAVPAGAWKAQVIVPGLEHNRFNRRLPGESGVSTNVSREQQEQSFAEWGMAFSLATLFGEERYRGVFEGTARFESSAGLNETLRRYRSSDTFVFADFEQDPVGQTPPYVSIDPAAPQTNPVVRQGIEMGQALLHLSNVLELRSTLPKNPNPFQSELQQPVGAVIQAPSQPVAGQTLFVDFAPNSFNLIAVLGVGNKLNHDLLAKETTLEVTSGGAAYALRLRDYAGSLPSQRPETDSDAPLTMFHTARIPLICLSQPGESGLVAPSVIDSVSAFVDNKVNDWLVLDDIVLEP